MITKFKLFENQDNILFKGDDFIIEINRNNILVASGIKENFQYSAVIYMATLIIKDSKYIYDDDLLIISISLGRKNKDFDRDNVASDSLTVEFRSSSINDCIYPELLKTLKNKKYDDIYLKLHHKYKKLFQKEIDKSETLGDIINNFKPLIEQLNTEVEKLVKITDFNI